MYVRLKMACGIFSYPYSGSPVWSHPTTKSTGLINVIMLCADDLFYKKRRTITHKASAGVTKRRPFICGFMKVVCIIEVVAQLSTYRHSPDEVRGDFFTTDLVLPGQEMIKMDAFVNRMFHCSVPHSEAFVDVLPVSFTDTEGKGEVGSYFFKVLQRNITILVLVIIFHDGLQGATEHWKKKPHLAWDWFCFSWTCNEEVKGSICCRVRNSHPPSDWHV